MSSTLTALGALVLLALPWNASATLISYVSLSSNFGQANCSAGGNPAACATSGTYTNPNDPYGAYVHWDTAISASAGYGHLTSDIYYDQSGFGMLGANFNTSAIASFTDTLTVLGQPPLQQGYIQYTFTGGAHFATWFGPNQFQFAQGGFAPEGISQDGNGFFSGYQTSLYSFTFGQPFTISATATAESYADFGEVCWHCTGFDWTLADISVYDQQMNPMPFAVTSASHSRYPHFFAPTPEPSSFVFLGTVIIGIVLSKFAKLRMIR